MIIFIIILVILLYSVERWSLENALNGVSYDYQSSKVLLAPGEEFEIITTITNNSRMLVPFVKIEELFPAETIFKDAALVTREDSKGNVRHISTVYLMPRSKLVRRITVSINNRGRYLFRGGELKGGDFLGISENSRHYGLFREVVVYPRETFTPDVLSLMGGFLGDISVRRFILEDPILTIGSREYTGKEPMKAISWSASARAGKLMVKQYDYTIDPAISVILDVEAGENEDSLIEKREFCYSMARTLCETLEGKGMKYDFITNADCMDAFSRWSYINEGSGSRHYSMILEGLGRAIGGSVETLSEIVTNLANRQDYDRSAILITSKNSGEYEHNVAYFEKKSKGRTYTIKAGDYIK